MTTNSFCLMTWHMTSAAESLGAHARMRQVGLFLLSWWMASMTVLVLPVGRGGKEGRERNIYIYTYIEREKGREKERERERERERKNEARLKRVAALQTLKAIN
jgi:hypothetical protein